MWLIANATQGCWLKPPFRGAPPRRTVAFDVATGGVAAMNTTLVAGPWALASDEEELVKSSATTLMEVVPELAVAMARHIHAETPALGEDDEAVEATRASCEANVREILIDAACRPAGNRARDPGRRPRVRALPARPRRRPGDGAARLPVRRLDVPAIGGRGVRAPVQGRGAARSACTDAVQAFVWVYIDRVFERLSADFADSVEPLPRSRGPGLAQPCQRGRGKRVQR